MSSFLDTISSSLAGTALRFWTKQDPIFQERERLLRKFKESNDPREKFNILYKVLFSRLYDKNEPTCLSTVFIDMVNVPSEETLISWMNQLVELANTCGNQYLVDESGQPSLERLVSSFEGGGDPTPFWLLMAYRRCYLAGNEEWQQKFFQEGTQQNEWRQKREAYRQKIINLCGGEEAMNEQFNGSVHGNSFMEWLRPHLEGQEPPGSDYYGLR